MTRPVATGTPLAFNFATNADGSRFAQKFHLAGCRPVKQRAVFCHDQIAESNIGKNLLELFKFTPGYKYEPLA